MNNEHHSQPINQKKYGLKPKSFTPIKLAILLKLVTYIFRLYFTMRIHKLAIHYFFSSFYINLLISPIKKERFLYRYKNITFKKRSSFLNLKIKNIKIIESIKQKTGFMYVKKHIKFYKIKQSIIQNKEIFDIFILYINRQT